jgi:HSP20 family protein
MSKLERWLPFMFKKKTQREKQQAQQPVTEPKVLSQPMPLQPMTPFVPMFSPQMLQLMRGFFDDPFFREPFGRFWPMDRWFGDFSPNYFSPSVEVSDEGKALKVTAELPGMEKDDIKLHLEGNMLIISGEKKSESENKDEGVFRTERFYGYFQRAIPIPEDVDRDKAEAEFKRGVLTIRFPKLESSHEHSKRIEIKG